MAFSIIVSAILTHLTIGSLWWTFVTHRKDPLSLALIAECEPVIAVLMVAEVIALWPVEVVEAFKAWRVR